MGGRVELSDGGHVNMIEDGKDSRLAWIVGALLAFSPAAMSTT